LEERGLGLIETLPRYSPKETEENNERLAAVSIEAHIGHIPNKNLEVWPYLNRKLFPETIKTGLVPNRRFVERQM
jgi:hypothetical protein